MHLQLGGALSDRARAQRRTWRAERSPRGMRRKSTTARQAFVASRVLEAAPGHPRDSLQSMPELPMHRTGAEPSGLSCSPVEFDTVPAMQNKDEVHPNHTADDHEEKPFHARQHTPVFPLVAQGRLTFSGSTRRARLPHLNSAPSSEADRVFGVKSSIFAEKKRQF